MVKEYIDVSCRKDYNWIDLPKDAVVDNVVVNNNNRIEIHYTSESGESYVSNGNFGFEYHLFMEGQNVEITIEADTEKRQIVYSTVLELKKEKYLIVIVKWEKI